MLRLAIASTAAVLLATVPAAGAASGSASSPRASTPAGLGPSVTLDLVRKRSDCRVSGPLPDTGCTPGARFSKVTTAQVCRSHYSSAVRNVSSSTKASIYARYGMTAHFDGRSGEVDHLVSLELGGSNSPSNLWPEAAGATYGSHQKDRLENELHTEVCAGRITLRAAQRAIARNWVAAYRARFG